MATKRVQVTVTYFVDVENELEVREAGFRIVRQDKPTWLGPWQEDDLKTAVVALLDPMPGELAPAIPGAKVDRQLSIGYATEE